MGLALAATSAWAQTPPAESPSKSTDSKDDVSLPGVDVRGQRNQYKIEEPSLYKLPDPIKDTPQSITVLPEQVLEERALFTLRDALRTVPGISLAAGEAGGRQGDNLTLRGFPAGNDIFIDGVRDLGQYGRDTFNLESVEVLKGPSAVMFGRGSTGGVINQVSKAPKLTPFYEISGTVGSGPQGRATVDINQPFGGSAALRLNLMGFKGDTPGRDHATSERWGAAPSFGIGLNGPTRLIVSYFYMGDDNLPDYGFPYLRGGPAPVDRENFYGLVKRDYEHDDVHIGTIRLEHDFNENVRFRNTLRLALIQRGSLISVPAIVGTPSPTTPLTSINVSRTGIERHQEDTSVINTTDVIVKFNTWRFKHTLVTGVEASRETSDVRRYTFTGVPITELVNPSAFANLSAMSRAKNFDGSSAATAVGVYAVDEMAITEQWKIMGGLRYDLFDADFRNRFASQTLSRTDEALSPRAALVFLPTKAQTYYFSYGTSFNPSAEALVLALNNASTEPEKNETFELGAKWDFLDGALGVRTAVFRTYKNNARTTDPVLDIQVTDGKQRVQGFRARGGRAGPAGLERLPRLRLPRLPSSGLPRRSERRPGRGQAPRQRARALGEPVDHLRHHQPVAGRRRRILRGQALRQYRQPQRGAVVRAGRRDGGLPADQATRATLQRHQHLGREVLRRHPPEPRHPGQRPHLPAHRDLEVLAVRCSCTSPRF
jgi:catecholate siderophore receptor